MAVWPRSPLVAVAGSAILSGATAWLILAGHRTWAGVVALLAAAGLLDAALAVSIGGALEATARRLAVAERVADRVFDACVLAPLAWVSRLPDPRVAVLSIVGLAASYLASYERARGQSLGYRGAETVPYLATRAGILVLGLLTGWVEAALWLFVALTVTASAVRAWNVVAQERHGGGPEGRAE